MPNSIDVGKCPFCKDFVFLSETEIKRHKLVFHGDQKERKAPLPLPHQGK